MGASQRGRGSQRGGASRDVVTPGATAPAAVLASVAVTNSQKHGGTQCANDELRPLERLLEHAGRGPARANAQAPRAAEGGVRGIRVGNRRRAAAVPDLEGGVFVDGRHGGRGSSRAASWRV